MGLVDRKKTGKMIDSKVLVPNQGIITSKIQIPDKLVTKITNIKGNN
jgi:hypothetical protein